ncbi:uncharacterized sugar kinase slr0537 [Impatiens glandulifera]|uniref:uncharacterized sugar kinase slr0537 n=1 Tax=Impatiens glandulifera TaxID=253017 RepID=UPI001FB0DFCE|nr:uncharacterized sugar kinase slr0537 [Impatiens glandulifera]
MGIEIHHTDDHKSGGDEKKQLFSSLPPLVLGLQPSALIDHVAKVDSYLLSKIPGETGGSFPVEVEELEQILTEVNIHGLSSSSPNEQSLWKTMAGGSVANSIRGLSAGFGISTGIIGTCGDDELGKLFQSNMNSYGVNISRLRKQNEKTAQCVCLVDELGNRTMRPCLSNAAKIQADELSRDDFKGSRWLVIRYAIANLDIIHSAIRIAKQEGLFISLDLASFEMVRKFREPLLELLESRNIDLCFANEDEAMELLRGEENSNPEAALEFLSKYCKWAVVTLGANGCTAKNGKEIVKVPAIGETIAKDATGAGDLFACGFLYGMVKGLSMEECCRIGTCSGAAVIRSLGGEVTTENWQWMHKQLETEGLNLSSNNNNSI